MQELAQAWARFPGKPGIVNIHVSAVTSQGGRRRFARLPWRLYRGDPRWVPPLLNEQLSALNPHHNPALADIEMALFLAEASGPGFLEDAVGTIAAWIDRGAAAAQDRRVVWFSHLETINNAEIASKLIEAAETWAFEHLQGLQVLRGPAHPDPRWPAGLLTDGFDQRPAARLPYNQPYLPEIMEAAGYTAIAAWRTYETPLEALINPAHDGPGAEFTVLAASAADVPDSAAFRAAFPRAVSASTGRTHLPGLFVAKIAGRVIAVAAAQPDLSRPLQWANGRWFPAGWLADRLTRPSARVHLWQPAVVSEWAGAGVERMLWGELAAQALRAGYRAAILGPVPAAEAALVAALEAVGARPAQTFHVYEKNFNKGEPLPNENDSMLW